MCYGYVIDTCHTCSTFQVQKWEAKITPYLEEEQAHREFHTNMYGDELLELFDGKLGRELPLTKVT